MTRFLVDVNLPYRFTYWKGEDSLHQRELGESCDDVPIWEYARAHKLITTKDKDFAERMQVSQSPSKVLWLRCGNCSLRQLHVFLEPYWPQALALLSVSKLVTITDAGIISI